MPKATRPVEPEQLFKCTFSVKADALFTETHCHKECQWLVYGYVNLMPTNPVGICCASFETLELDYKTNNFKRAGKCINTVADDTKGGDDETLPVPPKEEK